MKQITRLVATGLIVFLILPATANQSQPLSSTINSFMIEGYNFVLNINLLNELCGTELYLDVNTNSKQFKEKLDKNIERFAKLGKTVDSNLAAEVELKFKAYVQGVRYGGFIADNFIKTKIPEGICTPEMRIELAKTIKKLMQSDEFIVTTE